MGKSLNKVQVIGCLGKDPEVSYLPNGNAVANLSLATDESYNDKQTGQKVEQTEWHRITVYGKLAEIVQQYLKKGARVYFEGKLKTREWEKDGIKRYTTEIIASDMVMLDSKDQGQQPQQQGYQQQPQYQQPQQQQYAQPGHQPPPQQGGYQQPQQPQPQYQNPPSGQPQGAYQR